MLHDYLEPGRKPNVQGMAERSDFCLLFSANGCEMPNSQIDLIVANKTTNNFEVIISIVLNDSNEACTLN